MKKYFVLFSAAILALAGCAKEMAPVDQAGDTAVTFSIQTSAATKAAIDNDGAGANVDECRVAIYMKTGETYTLFDTVEAPVVAGKATFTANLIKAQTYKAVAWCDKAGMYTVNEDLTEIKRADDAAATCNADALDAFFGTTAEDFTVPVNQTVKIVTKRPFAQLNIIATDVNANFEPTNVTVKYTAPTVFNAVTGETSQPKEITFSADKPYYAAVAAKSTIVMDYVFASEEGEVLNEVAMTAKVTEVVEASFANVPAKRNFRTNIIGPLFTDPTDFEVDVDADWEDETDVLLEKWDGEASKEVTEDENNIYHITNAAELKGFADAVNGGDNFAGKTVVLDNSINLDGKEWTPIAQSANWFAGVFDGQGNTIYGLNVNTPSTNRAALFGGIAHGTIKNLTLDNPQIQGSDDYTATVCASGNGTIDNVTVKGGSVKGTDQVGGIAGFMIATTIKNCTLKGTEIDAAGDRAGGIIGKIDGQNSFHIDGNTLDGVTVKAAAKHGVCGAAGLCSQLMTNTVASGMSISNNEINVTTITAGVEEFVPIANVRDGYSMDPVTEANISGNHWVPETPSTVISNGTASVTILNDVPVATVGGVSYPTVEAAFAAAIESGSDIEITVAGTYTLPTISKNITIKGSKDVVFNCVGSGSIASIPNGCTFDGCTFEMGQNDYHGFQHAGTINMKDCTINGKFFSYGDMNFDGCTFNQTAKDYNMWCYGQDITYTNCTFNSKGKFLNIYNEGNGNWKITADGCTFNSDTKNKAALNIKASCGATNLGWDVTINNCTVNDVNMFPEASGDASSTLFVGSPVWQVDDRTASAIEANIVKVTVDGTVVYGNK